MGLSEDYVLFERTPINFNKREYRRFMVKGRKAVAAAPGSSTATAVGAGTASRRVSGTGLNARSTPQQSPRGPAVVGTPPPLTAAASMSRGSGKFRSNIAATVLAKPSNPSASAAATSNMTSSSSSGSSSSSFSLPSFASSSSSSSSSSVATSDHSLSFSASHYRVNSLSQRDDLLPGLSHTSSLRAVRSKGEAHSPAISVSAVGLSTSINPVSALENPSQPLMLPAVQERASSSCLTPNSISPGINVPTLPLTVSVS